MLDNKQLEQIKKRVSSYVQEGVITKDSKGKFVPFFMTNAKNSLEFSTHARSAHSVSLSPNRDKFYK